MKTLLPAAVENPLAQAVGTGGVDRLDPLICGAVVGVVPERSRDRLAGTRRTTE